MTVTEDLDLLRASWGETGIPRDAAAQIAKVLARHIGRRQKPKHQPTPNEGDWCERCGVVRWHHARMSPHCPGVSTTEPVDPEPGSRG